MSIDMLKIEIPGFDDETKDMYTIDIVEKKKPKKKRKSGAVTEFYGDRCVTENYFGTDVSDEERSPDKDFFLQCLEENKVATAEKVVSACNPIISQKKTNGESKSTKNSKKDEKINEVALAEMIAGGYDVGMYVGACFMRVNGVYERLTKTNTKIALGRILLKNQRYQLTSRLADGVFCWLPTLPSVLENKLEIPRSKVLFKNGLFDILSGERVEALKEEFVTLCINAKFKPRKYYETPVWDAFLDKCSGGNIVVKRLIMSFLGYLLLPGNPAKNFFVLGPAPDSGKSLLAEFVRRLVSEEAVCAVAMDDFQNDFVLAQIAGKSINLAMDIPGGVISRKSASAIKMLTGRDLVTINAKNEHPYKYRNFAKLVFASNDPITTKESDSAFWERMIIIPFLNSIPKKEQDSELLDKLWEERDGIVNQAVFFARELLENGFQFPGCPVAEVMKRNWISGRCPELASFVKTHCRLDERAWCPSFELHSSYCDYCRAEGYEPPNLQIFSQTLCGAYGLKSVRHSVQGTQYRGISGITLKNI